jgi:hypothetical protein
MSTGVRNQKKRKKHPTLTEGKHTPKSFCWLNLTMALYPKDITVFRLVFYCPKQCRAAFLTLETAIFVIHLKLT